MTEQHAYRRAMVWTAIAMAVLAVAGGAWGGAALGLPGVWAALAGAGVAGVSAVATQWAMLVGSRQRPEMFAVVVGGGWLAKMVVVVVAVVLLRQVESLPRAPFGWVVVVGLVATMVIDFLAVRAARVAYVDPGSVSDDT